jgi:hypothetical protein
VDVPVSNGTLPIVKGLPVLKRFHTSDTKISRALLELLPTDMPNCQISY